jgi:hypothetical protein
MRRRRFDDCDAHGEKTKIESRIQTRMKVGYIQPNQRTSVQCAYFELMDIQKARV